MKKFTLKSGNGPLKFKDMGSSTPAKQTYGKNKIRYTPSRPVYPGVPKTKGGDPQTKEQYLASIAPEKEDKRSKVGKIIDAIFRYDPNEKKPSEIKHLGTTR